MGTLRMITLYEYNQSVYYSGRYLLHVRDFKQNFSFEHDYLAADWKTSIINGQSNHNFQFITSTCASVTTSCN